MGKFLDKAGLQHYDEKIKAYVDSKSGGVNTNLTSHIGNKKNPHGVTKEQVGLGNVTNEAQIPLSQKGVTSGVATLGADGKLTAAQLPALKSVNGVSVVGSGNISIDLSLYKVVDTLPTTGIDATKIYIVPAQTTGDKNIKVEYVYTGDPTSTYDASKWEKLGEAQTNIVVDAYLSDTSINPVQNKAVKSAIDTLKQSITDVENKNIAQDTAIAGKLNKTDYVVDNELSPTSKNPVQNLVVNQKFDWFDKNIRNKAYVHINAKIPSTPQAAIGTSWALVPNPVTSEAYADDGGWHGRELTFSSALFATKEGLDSCMKKTDMTAITNEEIDAMF